MLKNVNVMQTHPEAFVTYRAETTKNDQRILRLRDEDNAVVLRPDHAFPHQALLKKSFQAAHKAATPLQEIAATAALYNMTTEAFRKTMRVVGCGTNAYLVLDDGVFQLAVQRSAPGNMPDGAVMASAYSRAAGGAAGPIDETALREWIEECNIFIRKNDGSLISADLIANDMNVDMPVRNTLLGEKYIHLRGLAQQLLPRDLKAAPVVQVTYEAQRLHVDGLTETILQDFNGDIAILNSKSVFDDAANGDMNIDDILVARLPGVVSSQIVICDGETDLDGKLLGRNWLLKPGAEFAAALKAGTMKFSPAPAKVIGFTPSIHDAIAKMKF